jgi:hypothetical protein
VKSLEGLFLSSSMQMRKLINQITGRDRSMKTGIIVYVVGDPPMDQQSDPKKLVKNLRLDADRVEIASQHLGHFDVHDAWWSLTSKGAQRILCTLAEFNPYGQIQLKGQTIRLCG